LVCTVTVYLLLGSSLTPGAGRCGELVGAGAATARHPPEGAVVAGLVVAGLVAVLVAPVEVDEAGFVTTAASVGLWLVLLPQPASARTSTDATARTGATASVGPSDRRPRRNFGAQLRISRIRAREFAAALRSEVGFTRG
jgi:hypothetical protein